MRDLKADLKGLQANPSDWTELPRGLVVEYLERAIAAGKKNTESYDLLYGVFDKVKEEAELLKIDKAALTEENDIQRASIQQLSAQVVGLREALEKLARLGNEPHYGNSIGNEIAKQALASPDPGEKHRERMSKMQAVVDAANELYEKHCKDCKAGFYTIGPLLLVCPFHGIIKQVLAEQEASR